MVADAVRLPARIRRGLEHGLRVVVDDCWDHLQDFIDIYYDTMRRVGAAPNYFFDRDYFEQLRRSIGDQIHLVLAAIDVVVACGGLFFEAGGIVEYHLSGTRTEYLWQSGPSSFLEFVVRWAKDRGNVDFDLGGGFGARSGSLFQFKLGFSPDRQPFHTWRIIVQEEPYRSLCERLNRTADPDDLTSYFPLSARRSP